MGPPMKSLLLFLLVFAMLAVVLGALRLRGSLRAGEADWPFYAKRLLSKPEQVLYLRLVRALPEHVVLAQVQVSRVLGVRKGNDFKAWNNRINRLSYDFVVCAKDATVLAVIELDDQSHASAARVEADARKDRATAAAGLTLIRWNVKALPEAGDIQAAIRAAQAARQAASSLD